MDDLGSRFGFQGNGSIKTILGVLKPVMFPKRGRIDGITLAQYDTFRHSWILIERQRPVVPRPENTPLPNRKQSKKNQDQTILYVYKHYELIQSQLKRL